MRVCLFLGGLQISVGQNQWYHFAVGARPILVYFSGVWDVYWVYGILIHGQRLVSFWLSCKPKLLEGQPRSQTSRSPGRPGSRPWAAACLGADQPDSFWDATAWLSPTTTGVSPCFYFARVPFWVPIFDQHGHGLFWNPWLKLPSGHGTPRRPLGLHGRAAALLRKETRGSEAKSFHQPIGVLLIGEPGEKSMDGICEPFARPSIFPKGKLCVQLLSRIPSPPLPPF